MKKLLSVLFILSLLSASPVFAATIVATWNANTETDLAGYGIYNNGTLVGSIGVMESPTFSILSAADGVYVITVDAFDATGNRSLKSDSATITVDSIAPAVPAKPTVVITGSSAKLTWVANTETDLAGYGIYHDGVLAGSIGVMASPTFTITGLPDGSHTFTIDSVDTSGNRSAKSAAATATTDVTAPVKPSNLKITYTK